MSAAKFGKKTEEAAFASLTAADVIRAPVVMRTIALDFVSLVAPYRRHGRLSLRVEYVPQRARLSAGRNNGDGSWSLASDELEGLTYLAPDNLAPEHTLLLRIMALEEAGATTLKILHVPVSLQADGSVQADAAAAGGADGENPILHNQLEKMQSLFAVREDELNAVRAALQQAKDEKDIELARSRAVWEQELQQRLSDAVTQAQAAWHAQHKANKSAEKTSAQAEQKIAQARERWQAQADQRLEAERARWLAESADTRAKSMAGERARWQVEADMCLAAEQERWQMQADQRLEVERARWQSESADALAKGIAHARAHWQVEAEQRLEVEHARWKAESQGGVSQTILQERARWEAEAEQRLEAEGRRWEAANAAALTEAAAIWKAQEDQRLAAVQAQAREEAARLVAEAAAKSEALEVALAEARSLNQTAAQTDLAQADGLREELAKMQSLLVRRDLELDQYRLSREQEREHRRQELEASLSAAARAWKADEDTRLAAMMERARSQSDAALAAATARCEAAEKALAEAQNGQGANPADDAYVQGLQKEIATLRASLVNREVELGHTRAALDRMRARPVQSAAPAPIYAPAPAPIQRMMRSIDDPVPQQADVSAKRGLVRDFIVAVCVITPLIFFYPRLEAYLPDEVRANIAAVTGGFWGAAPAPQPQAAAPAAPPVAARKTATVNHAANMRATPGSKGAVTMTLPKGTAVTIVEQRGNWTLVEIAPKTATDKPQQGFVFGAYLTGNI